MESAMKNPTADEMRDNAHNCGDLASEAKDEPGKKRYRRMEAAWNSLAETQDWLDGKKKSEGTDQSEASPQAVKQSEGERPQ
jgi:hypothetical protein